MSKHFNKNTPVNDETLTVIALLPTEHLPKVVDQGFYAKLTDKDFMRIGTLLAEKSYNEGGCPIGGVIIDKDRRIIGKGHNTLGQENDSTTHGETAALRDAGRVAKLNGQGPVDFRDKTMFTTLTPCKVCCAQIKHRCNFANVVIGDVTNAPSTEPILRANDPGEDNGIKNVTILEDPKTVALYAEYAAKRPDLNALDWRGHKEVDRAVEAGEIPGKHAAMAKSTTGRVVQGGTSR